MAYINSESVKQMRNQIKNLYPVKQGWKFSITRENYSNVRCVILAAPIELRVDNSKTNEGVNNYYIETRYNGENEKATEVLKSINQILNTDNFDESDSMTDYFHVGHYVSISIGSWDKPFTLLN
jgi:hypothetical protein